MVEIWDNSERLGIYARSVLPKPGDILEMDIDGTVSPYVVEKLINYYALNAVDPVLRIIVKYDGPGFFGVL